MSFVSLFVVYTALGRVPWKVRNGRLAPINAKCGTYLAPIFGAYHGVALTR